jgi:hypothetical protein
VKRTGQTGPAAVSVKWAFALRPTPLHPEKDIIMLKRFITLSIAAALTLSAGSAPAFFEDLKLVRVYYERTTGTEELATDLGSVSALVASGGSVAGNFGTVNTPANLFAVYYAIDHAAQVLWVSGSPSVQPVAVGSPGFTSAKSATSNVAGYYQSAALGSGQSVTAQQSYTNSYRLKLTASQGAIANAINIATRPNTEASLADLVNGVATSVTQILYYLATPNTGGSLGVAKATITTNADGSTTISAPPPTATAPGAPTGVTAVAGNNSDAIVSFTPPTSNGGSAIDLYTATSSPDGLTGTIAPPGTSITVPGLNLARTYTFTVTAHNVIGTGPASNPASNSVTPKAPPTAASNPASLIIQTGTTLNGTVSANNAATTVTFEYGPTSAYGTTVTAAQSPLVLTAANTTVSAAISGLTCNSVYHFRVVALNSVGTTPGLDQPFTTAACSSQAIGTVSFLPPNLTAGSSTTASAVASSGLPVSFGTTSPSTVCTVAGSVVTGAGLGTCSVTADQIGNASFAPAPPVIQTIEVVANFIKIDSAAVPENTISLALARPLANASVYVQAGPLFVEQALMDNPLTIALNGGFTAADFNSLSQTSYTVIKGSLTIKRGKLIANRIIVRQ